MRVWGMGWRLLKVQTPRPHPDLLDQKLRHWALGNPSLQAPQMIQMQLAY